MHKVHLRPLELKDALTSFRWRNDPEIWKYTGSRPDIHVTPELETDWLKNVLLKEDQKRFAICIDTDSRYIGNIQLTEITLERAQYHIFIGEKEYWGKGIGKKATQLLLEYSFNTLGLNEIYLYVRKNNVSAIKLYEKCGFHFGLERDNQIKMVIRK